MRSPLKAGGPLAWSVALAAWLGLQACGQDPTRVGTTERRDVCSIPADEIFSGALKDAIPALSDSPMADSDSPDASAWRDSDRVVGVVLEGQPIAVPLNILWWHEVVNLTQGGNRYAVTHCPLTGSSLAFEMAGIGFSDFGVSGLLFRNNLVMYDRAGGDDEEDAVVESLWPQMSRGARCGPRNGTDLVPVPVLEITWAGWKALHPNTIVLTPDTGHDRPYTFGNPYGIYQIESNSELAFHGDPIDPRRPPKERVFGVPAGTGGVAYPFGLLQEQGPTATVHGTAGGEEHVVMWDADKQAAMAYRPMLDGQSMTFVAKGDRIEDQETGSEWNVGGTAVAGPLTGRTLEAVEDAFVAFWFSWLPFHPDMRLWAP